MNHNLSLKQNTDEATPSNLLDSFSLFKDVRPGHCQDPLELHVCKLDDSGRLIDGYLQAKDGFWYPIISGVPVFLIGDLRPSFSEFKEKYQLASVTDDFHKEAQLEQKKTNVCFSDKWQRFKNYGFEEKHQEFLYEWYVKKLGFKDLSALKDFYSKKERVLEVGPGSGFNTRFMAECGAKTVCALDVSEAAFTTYGNVKDLPNCSVVQADLAQAPFPNDHFDFIIADGVLHHTPNTFDSLKALYQKLQPRGSMFFYIYRRMGAARQFVDQHIRDSFMKLSPEECYEACRPLTNLGKALHEANVRINLDEPIDVLGIPAGDHNIQRLFYYNFVKCFWNDAFDFETNNMVNFDWYYPHNAWQHTQEEVEGWLAELGIKEYQFNDSNPNGLSVLFKKP